MIGRLQIGAFWSNDPTVSTLAGRAAQADSRNRFDRCTELLGASHCTATLSRAEELMLQDLWATIDGEYASFFKKFNRYSISFFCF